MPKISVITPVYNGAKTIKKTIDSVLNQTFTDIELIVIDDGSSDSTLDIISTISDPRLKIYSYNNAGVSASRNRGLSKATGEYISFIDADDIWTPDKLQSQLNALLSTSDAAIAYSWTDWIDENDQFLRPGGHITANGDVYIQLLIRDFIESGSNPLIKREAFHKVGGFDETLTTCADWDMWLRLAAKYKFISVPKAHILYRVNPNSMSSNIWLIETESLQVIAKAFQNLPDSQKRYKQECLSNRYKYLTFKAVEGIPERSRGLAALRFLIQTIRTDPAMLTKTKTISIVLFKIAVAILLPSKYASALLIKLKSKKMKKD